MIAKQIEWLKKHNLLFQVNILVIVFGVLLFGSRLALGLQNLPSHWYDIAGWRTTPTTDHVWIWIGLLVFFLYQLRVNGFKGNLAKTSSIIYSLGDLFLVVGTVDICWNVVSYFVFHTDLVVSAEYSIILWIGIYLSLGRLNLKQFLLILLPQIPMYIAWIAVGFQTSLVMPYGVYAVTQYQFSPIVNGFEVSTWIIPCLLFIASKKLKWFT